MQNTGTTVQIRMKNSASQIQDGACGEKKYIFEQMHFHWGKETSKRGSEHMIDDKAWAFIKEFKSHLDDKIGT